MKRARAMCGFAALAASTLLLACGSAPEGRMEEGAVSTDGGALLVYVVNYPLQYFAERIGGDLVQVEFPAPDDVDPAYWTPGPAAVVDYQSADLILLNGADYAHWVGRTTLPGSKLVNTSALLADHFVEVEGAVTHSHGPEGDHSHGAVAFTIWLDLTLAIEQARAIKDAFSAARPDDANAFEEAFADLETDLKSIDDRLSELASRFATQPLLGSHPVYQYLSSRYGLDLVSVHLEPDEVPEEGSWRDLEQLLADHPARWMLWEGEPLPATADRLRDLGIGIIVFDPCANVPESGDFLSVLQQNANNLAAAVSG